MIGLPATDRRFQVRRVSVFGLSFGEFFLTFDGCGVWFQEGKAEGREANEEADAIVRVTE